MDTAVGLVAYLGAWAKELLRTILLAEKWLKENFNIDLNLGIEYEEGDL